VFLHLEIRVKEHRVPLAYSRAEDCARSLYGRRDDDSQYSQILEQSGIYNGAALNFNRAGPLCRFLNIFAGSANTHLRLLFWAQKRPSVRSVRARSWNSSCRALPFREKRRENHMARRPQALAVHAAIPAVRAHVRSTDSFRSLWVFGHPITRRGLQTARCWRAGVVIG
jgi:hypothetical protein